MRRRFVIEAVMIATYGHLLVPRYPVDYVIPYSSIAELYEIRESNDPVMDDLDEDQYVKTKVNELILFFEDALNRKKIEKAIGAPWRESTPLLLSEQIQFTIVNAMDTAQYGELFDPVETELLLTGIRLQIPLLTDQFDFQDKLIEAEVPVQIYDIEDFEFAVEEGISAMDIEG
ncbi:ADP-heptose synthase [Paenibacillus sp. HB172176]|uniref:ADP-heptose synthase n=1 Tax=Paenibacillus sp. HB172176 TaxID=2493690 RepID=UPI00143889F2|nr:ADP-heptose synthase [Paenibacillus sp. HB172176]